jgi:hypothetical protein
MRTEKDVRAMLESHVRNMLEVDSPEKLKKRAETFGHSEDWFVGYVNGVRDAYRIVLQFKPGEPDASFFLAQLNGQKPTEGKV